MFMHHSNVIPCTTHTAKILAEISQNEFIYISGVPECFNVHDFCDLLKNGIISNVYIIFAENTSVNYQTRFKAVVEEKKTSWTTEIEFK